MYMSRLLLLHASLCLIAIPDAAPAEKLADPGRSRWSRCSEAEIEEDAWATGELDWEELSRDSRASM